MVLRTPSPQPSPINGRGGLEGGEGVLMEAIKIPYLVVYSDKKHKMLCFDAGRA